MRSLKLTAGDGLRVERALQRSCRSVVEGFSSCRGQSRQARKRSHGTVLVQVDVPKPFVEHVKEVREQRNKPKIDFNSEDDVCVSLFGLDATVACVLASCRTSSETPHPS